MSKAFEAEVTIDRPARDVWNTLTDWDNAHRWMSGVDWIKADGATTVGTTLTFHARGKDRPAEIARCEPGQSMVVRSVQGGVTADYEYALHPLDDGRTRVTLVAECQTRGLLWSAAAPLLRMAMRLADGKQLEALESVIQAG